MRDYEEHRINSEVPVRESADFSDETHTQFAWRAGVGVNYTIPEQDDAWTISVLTRYNDLGVVSEIFNKAVGGFLILDKPYPITS